MTRNKILTSLATVALIAATPALAKPGGGGGGGGNDHGQGGVNAGLGGGMGGGHGHGGLNVGVHSGGGIGGLERGRSESGIDMMSHGMGHNQLTGVTDGMTVVDSSGATVGTVTDINTRGNGSVKNVEVTLNNGETVTLKSKNLSVDGDVLTTTTVEGQAANRRVNSQGAANANLQGLIHANERSALASAGVTTLTGLTTGLTVENSGGTSLGTVSQIFTNQSGAVVGINVLLSGGGTVFIPATTLSIDGTTVVTSSTQF